MTAALAAVPYLGWLVAMAGLALGAELLVLVVSWRRLEAQSRVGQPSAGGPATPLETLIVPSRAWEIIGALAPLLIVAVGLAGVRLGRRHLLEALATMGDGATTPLLLSRAISEEMNAVPGCALATSLVVVLACFAVGCAVSARLRAKGLRHAASFAETSAERAAWVAHPGPPATLVIGSLSALVYLGLGPAVTCIYSATLIKIKGFAALARINGPEKLDYLLAFLHEATGALQKGLAQSRIGLGVGAAIAVALTVAFSSARGRSRLLGRREPWSGSQLVLPSLLTAMAVALYAIALPMQRENEMSWPPCPEGDKLLLKPGMAPDLDGPDPIERAPLVLMTPDQVFLNGMPVEGEQLHGTLLTLKRQFMELHPDRDPETRLVFACTPDTPVRSVMERLETVATLGFTRSLFAFVRHEVSERPLFGHLERNRSTGARVELLDDRAHADPRATIISPHELHTCAELSARIVQARRQGRPVALVVRRPW